MKRRSVFSAAIMALTGAMALILAVADSFGGILPGLPMLPSKESGAIGSPPVEHSEAKGEAIPYPSLLLYEKEGTADTIFMGYSVAGGGDVNGDGVADFMVGAPLASPNGIRNAGSAFVYSGQNGSLLYQINGTDSAEVVGVSVAILGDVNNDGRAEFIIGAPYADPGGQNNAGSAYLFSGLNGSLLQQKDGAATEDNFGWSVSRAGNVNADANPDYIIGAPYADSGSLTDAGTAYVFSGSGGGLIYRKYGAMAGDQFGWSVAGAGDINQDGRADFIVGHPIRTRLKARHMFSRV